MKSASISGAEPEHAAAREEHNENDDGQCRLLPERKMKSHSLPRLQMALGGVERVHILYGVPDGKTAGQT